MYHNSAFVNPPHTLRCVIHQYIVLANNNNNSTRIACQCNNGNDGVRSTATRISWKRAFQLVYFGMHASELMRRMIHFIIYILQQTRISSIVYMLCCFCYPFIWISFCTRITIRYDSVFDVLRNKKWLIPIDSLVLSVSVLDYWQFIILYLFN